ncbi:MAG TPA: hypothetical protein EYP56_14430 [Planctomycetaceae bacterium]|nr:hypothetical protein [Planctomycetaceae bacterium]
MAAQPEAIIRAKLHRPPVAADYVCRKPLHDRLQQARHLPFILVSAPAGYGKSTLISHWLQSAGVPYSWLSLDEADSNLRVFISYFVAAVRAIRPAACQATQRWLQGDTLPDSHTLSGALSNDLDSLEKPFYLALDDYHHIHNPAVHDLLDHLLEHPPGGLRLVIMSRRDPPLSLAHLLARHQMTDIRMRDLQFTEAETAVFLRRAVGQGLDASVVKRLHQRTEGWPAALRLAALGLQHRGDVEWFCRGSIGHSRQLQEYMTGEFLAEQPPEARDCLCRISILDRFCAPLCRSVCHTRCGPEKCAIQQRATDQAVVGAGVLCIPLDDREQWFRYHHLFRELLQRTLADQLSPGEIAELHRRAAAWFEGQGLLDEAIRHALRGDGPEGAARLVARYRNEILKEERWHQLGQWLSSLPPGTGEDIPGFLILKAWYLENRGRFGDMYQLLDRLEQLLQTHPPDERSGRQIRGEIDALRSYQRYAEGKGTLAVAHAQRALEQLGPECLNQRGYALILLAAALQMVGEVERARRAVHEALADVSIPTPSTYHTRLMYSLCFVDWMAADIRALKRTAAQALQMSNELGLAESGQVGRYFVGIAAYQLNDLAEAEAALKPVVADPWLPRMEYFVHSALALAAVHQARGRPDEATATVDGVADFLLKLRNTSLLRFVDAFRAELALRQDRLAEALRWAEPFDPEPFSPIYQFYAPQTTLAKVLVARGGVTSATRVAQLLERMEAYLTKIHNRRFLIEILAIKALFHRAQGDLQAATRLLERAVSLAQPGGLVRVFVDLGEPMAELFERVEWKKQERPLATRIAAAFQTDLQAGTAEPGRRVPAAGGANPGLSNLLTRRELEMLHMLDERLSNKEIAARLHIAPATVKRHAENIYRKLDVSGRREAVEEARRLGLLDRT